MQDLSFRFLGFPVHVQPGFLFVAGIVLVFGLQRQDPLWLMAATVGVIFVSVLVHELGHALVSRAFGVSVDGIWIHGFGGEVRHGRCGLGQHVVISLSGPGAGLLLGGASLAGLMFAFEQPELATVLSISAGVNLFWSLFNLLPIYPMDGGQAMYASLLATLAPRTAGMITFGTGALLGVGVALLGLSSGFLFAGLFAGSFAFQNIQHFTQVRGMLPRPAREA